MNQPVPAPPAKAEGSARSALGRLMCGACALHGRLSGALDRHGRAWLTPLAARAVILATLVPYYLNSALTKPGDGMLGVLTPAAGAFAQMLPGIAESYSYNTAAIPFVPWHLVVIFGTLAEFALPVLVALGAATRLAAIALIGFIAVQTGVDIWGHGAETGLLFDRQPGDLLDQRLFWMFPLAVLVLHGGGALSLDGAARRHRRRPV